MKKLGQIFFIALVASAVFGIAGRSNSTKAQTAPENTQQAQKFDDKKSKKQAAADRKAAEIKSKADVKLIKETYYARDVISTNGVGEKAKLHLQLRDNTKLSGWVSQLTMNDFTLNDESGQSARTIAYRDVAKAKGKNPAVNKKGKSNFLNPINFIPF